MKTDNLAVHRVTRNWYDPAAVSLDELRAAAARRSDPADHPLAARIEANQVPVYDGAAIRDRAGTDEGRRAIMAEWVAVFRDGAGIVAIERAFSDAAIVDRATAAFERIIADERASGAGAGDHFAKAGANDRIWNALGKLCTTDPEACARYYANEIVALVSEAWLGPAYTVTSQVNVVRPGGQAQTPHRDYHLGFQAADAVARYPAHVHSMSPMLTLQGAVAHCDMPLESGPTLYMPFTQGYGPGYLAAQDPAVRDWFERERVQLPLRKGDAVFFNPALLHAAGTNVSADIRRVANLLQVSSAFGRPMESLDHATMITTVYPVLRRAVADNTLSRPDAARAIAALADGYSFPTNLDRDPPIGGLAPQTQQALAAEALAADRDPARFAEAVTTQAARRRP